MGPGAIAILRRARKSAFPYVESEGVSTIPVTYKLVLLFLKNSYGLKNTPMSFFFRLSMGNGQKAFVRSLLFKGVPYRYPGMTDSVLSFIGS